MSYNPKTDWQLNEIVMPADMNRIEQGIADLDSHSINYLGEITEVTNILNNPSYGEYPYEGIISSEVATNIGLSAIEWNIKCFRSSEGSGCQIAFPVYDYSGESPKYRLATKSRLNGSDYKISWGEWSNFSGDGNATTLEGKHSSDFVQNSLAWTSGDITALCEAETVSKVLTISSGVTGMPVKGAWFGFLEASSSHRKITVTTVSSTGITDTYVKTAAYFNNQFKWNDWKNIADGGNAATINTVGITTASQYYPLITESHASTDGSACAARTVDAIKIDVNDTIAQLIAGIASSKDGMLALYQTDSDYSTILRPSGGLTAHTTIILPNSAGTLALDTPASATSAGLVTTSSQHFKGLKYFDDSVWISNPDIVMGNGAPSADTIRGLVFTSSDDSSTNASARVMNVVRSSGNNELYLKVRSLTSKEEVNGLTIKVNADNSNHFTAVANPSSPTQSALRNLASGTAEKNTTNCPSGSWYGKHD